jgi:hypothetical protein
LRPSVFPTHWTIHWITVFPTYWTINWTTDFPTNWTTDWTPISPTHWDANFLSYRTYHTKRHSIRSRKRNASDPITDDHPSHQHTAIQAIQMETELY